MKPVPQIARGLGWFSIVLGLTEVLGGRQMEGAFGRRNRRNLFRAFGLREIAAGLGILLPRRPTAPWLWARVGGDLLDLGALGQGLRLPRARRDNLAWATLAVAAVTALDVFCAWRLRAED